MQVKFCKDVLSFINVVQQLGNPFLATRKELIALNTENVMEPAVVASLSQIHEAAQTLHAAYVKEKLEIASARRVCLAQHFTILEAEMTTSTQRIDAVWDNYSGENNLKYLTQKRRGNGSRTKVGDGSNVLSNMPCDVTKLQTCNHSEADTRVLLNLAHAAEQGHTTAYVCIVDSNVVILAICFFETLGLTELWVGPMSIPSTLISVHQSPWHYPSSTA